MRNYYVTIQLNDLHCTHLPLAILLQLKRRNYHPVHLLSIAPESPADSFNSSLHRMRLHSRLQKEMCLNFRAHQEAAGVCQLRLCMGSEPRRRGSDPPLAHLRRADRRRGRRHEPLPCRVDADGIGATTANCSRCLRWRWRRRWITAEDELLSPQAVHHGSRVQHRHEANKGGHRQEPQPASGARHVAAAAAPQSETCNFC